MCVLGKGCGRLASESELDFGQFGARGGASRARVLPIPPRLTIKEGGIPPFDHVTFIYVHSAAGAAAAAALVCCYYSGVLFFLVLLRDTVCGLTTEYLDLIDYNYYTVRCCTTYEYVFVYTCLLLYTGSVLLYCCCCYSCCCLLLMFFIVCRMAKFVPVVHCI